MTAQDRVHSAAEGAANADVYEERTLGFWLYMLSDAVIFALLFATYVVMAGNIADAPSPQSQFSLSHAFGETLLLLTSSLTFGLASLAQKANRPRLLQAFLLVTFLLGLGFVLMELVEFQGMIAAGASPDQSGALSSFFVLVGTHGLHVSVGLLWILVIMSQVALKGLTAPVSSRLARLGLFWHFLDIIWVGIFSVVYLPGVLE
ncbi:cytochrome o ubiquinol oxidase subunit III [Fodinicurvata sediminis]|uniref:cytochrome o ubiquinol oxidase subunit III n=1 Tax=Fodinicurvata sediminis TaxID=1121832 RepID=UPI0003B7BAFB|nr:cytochrome o ubiquinol oxidase subunit III [Fodinicurvata sediminis]